MDSLSPTAYALLGLLARRSASAYELNKVMQNSILRAYWPRAESHVYTEPKKLLSQGLVTAERAKLSGRSRTLYHITAAGRAALQTWLASPASGTALLQFEAMLKFVCADSGDVAAMQQNLDIIRLRALQDAKEALMGLEHGYLSVSPKARQGLPFNAMAINYTVDLIELRLRWAEQTAAQLADLQTTGNSPANREMGEKHYELALQRLQALVQQE